MLYKQNLNYHLRYGCLPRAASDNYPASALQDSLLPCQTRTLLASRRTGFSEGKSGSHPHAWLRKRRRGRGAHKVPYEQKRGGVAGHPQREAKAVWKGREGARGVVSLPYPNPSLLFSLHCLTSPCKCQQVSFYNSFSTYLLEVLHTYASLEITVVMMPGKLYKQFLLKAKI